MKDLVKMNCFETRYCPDREAVVLIQRIETDTERTVGSATLVVKAGTNKVPIMTGFKSRGINVNKDDHIVKVRMYLTCGDLVRVITETWRVLSTCNDGSIEAAHLGQVDSLDAEIKDFAEILGLNGIAIAKEPILLLAKRLGIKGV